MFQTAGAPPTSGSNCLPTSGSIQKINAEHKNVLAVSTPAIRWEGVMVKEFRDFVTRGNVLDLAVAVMIGAAFGKIVDSLVNDILMPPIGLILGRVDFSKLFIALDGQQYPTLDAAVAAEAPIIKYGVFLNNVISFLIVAFTIFLVVRQVNRFRKPAPAPPVSEKECPHCATKIPLKATRCPNCTSALQAA